MKQWTMIILLSWCVFTRKFMYLGNRFCVLLLSSKTDLVVNPNVKTFLVPFQFCTFMDTNDVVYTFFFCPPKQVHVEKRDYSTDTD